MGVLQGWQILVIGHANDQGNSVPSRRDALGKRETDYCDQEFEEACHTITKETKRNYR
jgi:hypothetical protein